MKKQIICKTFFGLETILADELQQFGALNIRKLKRAVACEYNQQLLYTINLRSRFTLKTLIPILEFTSNDIDNFYKEIYNFNWNNIFNINQTFTIDFTVQSPYFKHSKFASLKMKDAICDYFRKAANARPNIDTENPDIPLHLHIYNERITIALDASGKSLHKRGYRQSQHQAPINEVLAAGLIALSNWNKEDTFIDGMCGSATILCEAAFMAYDIPPNMERNDFAFKHWKDFDDSLFHQTKLYTIKENIPTKLIGIESDFKNLLLADKNLIAANLQNKVRITNANFFTYTVPKTKGVCIINPPYGERMRTKEINELYKKIGDAFKNKYQGYTCGIISSNFEALKYIGLKPSKKIEVYNGKLPCKFQLYDIY
ncbi:MAG: class I SAM-dependent RNA methyltransferase [Chitinophagales bacterium]|nr:class I SAM-dependent RNA methyltransferase [Chitinophagales bacterium]